MSSSQGKRLIGRRQVLIETAAVGAGSLLATYSLPLGAATPDHAAQPPAAGAASPAAQAAGPAKASAPVERYSIAADVRTTVERTVVPIPVPPTSPEIYPREVATYERYGYGKWQHGPGSPIEKRLDLLPAGHAAATTGRTEKLVSFFTISDIHIDDKESPAVTKYLGYQGGSSSGYSGVVLYTTHVLDTAVQTINALHRQSPFDFGLSLGDNANNTQFNELRWFIDVLDGRTITPSSGAHIGAGEIDYQRPYQAAGLERTIPWYSAIGNHDQHWSGAGLMDDRIRRAMVGDGVLEMGNLLVNGGNTKSRGFYVGRIDGSTPYGNVVDAGPIDDFATPPKVVADPDRRSLATSSSLTKGWMREFSNTTSNPRGHGFSNPADDLACYAFEPKPGGAVRVIVLDDNSKAVASPPPMHCAAGSLDRTRLDWLVGELEKGQRERKLMIIAAHIPVGLRKPDGSPDASFSSASDISESELMTTLHRYPNLILWVAGHRHRNTITAQPSPDPQRPELGFWEVETASLRDFPQQFRRFDIVRNSDGTVSIIAICVDTAVAAGTPAARSRTYAIAAQQIFGGPLDGAPSGAINRELVVAVDARR
jgi:metallophosphoesterase (TIGR03768 family)